MLLRYHQKDLFRAICKGEDRGVLWWFMEHDQLIVSFIQAFQQFFIVIAYLKSDATLWEQRGEQRGDITDGNRCTGT